VRSFEPEDEVAMVIVSMWAAQIGQGMIVDYSSFERR